MSSEKIKVKKIKCWLLVLFVLFFSVFSSCTVLALNGTVGRFYYRIYSLNNDSMRWSNDLDVGDESTADSLLINYEGGARLVRAYLPTTVWTGNQLVTHWEINIVCSAQTYSNRCNWFPTGASTDMSVQNVRVDDHSTDIKTAVWSYAVTEWYGSDSTFYYNSTLTLYIDVISETNLRSGVIDIVWGNPDLLFFLNDSSSGGSKKIYLEKIVGVVNSTSNASDTYLNSMINQNNTIINQQQEQYDKENSAVYNIENQTSSDVGGAENQQTTNLLGFIGDFIAAITGFTANNNCNLDVPFPSFMGGTTTANLCQGKDLVGNAISIFASIGLILFYIPLAFKLLSMIFNEIRSWTNG